MGHRMVVDNYAVEGLVSPSCWADGSSVHQDHHSALVGQGAANEAFGDSVVEEVDHGNGQGERPRSNAAVGEEKVLSLVVAPWVHRACHGVGGSGFFPVEADDMVGNLLACSVFEGKDVATGDADPIRICPFEMVTASFAAVSSLARYGRCRSYPFHLNNLFLKRYPTHHDCHRFHLYVNSKLYLKSTQQICFLSHRQQ